MSSTLLCQPSSNSYPKTITGQVNFGKDTFSVFTQAQKTKILETIIAFENCNTNAILDSIIISHYQAKAELDSAAYTELDELSVKQASEIRDYRDMLINRNRQIAKDSVYIHAQAKEIKKQYTLKKVGTTIATVVSFVAGVLVTAFIYPIVHR